MATMNKKISPTILVTSGLVDLLEAGNQVIKNTLIGYANIGFNILVLTAIPPDYPELPDYTQSLRDLANRIRFIRMPGVFNNVFYVMRKIKNAFKKSEPENTNNNLPKRYLVLSPQSYHADIGCGAHLIYFLAWIAYLIIGCIQGSLLILKNRPNLVYGFTAYGAPVASILGQLFRIPIVTRFQGTFVTPTGWRKNLFKYPHAVLALRSPSNAIVMTNDGTHGDRVLKSLGVAKEKTYFWLDGLEIDQPNSLPSEQELRRQMGINPDTRVLLSVSMLKFWKRIDRMINAVAVLKHEFNYEDFLLLIVGNGPERKNLEKLAAQLGIGDCVRFEGAVHHEKVSRYYKITDVFLLLNDTCNLCNTLLEALYYGCSIITLDDGSNNDVITNEYNGILVDVDKLEVELPKAIHRVLLDGSLREKLEKNAKKFAECNLLTWEDRMKKEIEIVEKIIKDKRKEIRKT